METNNLISIIVPVFNATDFVLNSYEEILNQNLQDYELIYVDNNSTDDTVVIINNLIERDNRVQLFNQPIQGAGAARNEGIDRAKGEFLYFFDVDDQLFPNAINSLLIHLKKHPNMDSFFGRRTKNRSILKVNELQLNELIFKEKPYWGLHWFNQFSTLMGPPSFLHRKRVIEKIGNFPEQILIGEDAAFHIKLGLYCNIGYTNDFIYYYHRHEKSTVSDNNKKTNRIDTYWSQYINFYIPFVQKHKDEVLEQFIEILKKNIGFSFAKKLLKEKTLKKRLEIYKQSLQEMAKFKLPFITMIVIRLLSIKRSRVIFKIYVKLYYEFIFKINLRDKNHEKYIK